MDDLVVRFGGNEFIVLLENIRSKEDTTKIVTKIRKSLNKTMLIKSYKIELNINIGISIFPDDAKDIKDILKFANLAMQKSKELGHNRYNYFNIKLLDTLNEKLQLDNRIKRAIENDEFIVHYQPKFDIFSQKIVGLEALVRWLDPNEGMIPPFKFIPYAEDNDLIGDIDNIVMKKAFKECSRWEKDGLEFGRLSLNLSAKDLNKDRLIDRYLKNMKKYDFKKEFLELEVTETTVMSNPQKAIDILEEFNKYGITIAIDDFGTGYSSLSYLKKLPIDTLKIDRSFIRDIPKEKNDIAIVKAIVALAKSLDLNIVAEGVETKEQNGLFKEYKDTNIAIQGYFYSKPLPSKEIEELLRAN